MPPSACSQSASENPPANASMTIRRASSRVSLSRSAVWTRRALWTCVCTLTVYQDQVRTCLSSVKLLPGLRPNVCHKFTFAGDSLGERPPRARPVQPHRLSGADLGDLVDVLVGHHADDRIAAGDRMVWPEDHRKTVRRHLDCATRRALAGQLTVRPAVLQRHADQPHAD